MFEHSPQFLRLQSSVQAIEGVMREIFIDDFITHLNRRKPKDASRFLMQLGHFKSYSAVVRGSAPKHDLYMLLYEVDDLFSSREAFRKELEDRLNAQYSGNDPDMWLTVELKEPPDKTHFPEELMTFHYGQHLAGD